MGKIVVGIDGSENSHKALEWAVEEAKARDATLHLVHSWTFPPPMPLASGQPSQVDFEKAAREVLDQAVAQVGEEVRIECEIANELPAQALIRASEGADLLVVGSRGLGGFKGLLLGSVSQQCAHHSRCPVVLVPFGR